MWIKIVLSALATVAVLFIHLVIWTLSARALG